MNKNINKSLSYIRILVKLYFTIHAKHFWRCFSLSMTFLLNLFIKNINFHLGGRSGWVSVSLCQDCYTEKPCHGKKRILILASRWKAVRSSLRVLVSALYHCPLISCVGLSPSCPLKLILPGIPLAFQTWLVMAFALHPQHLTWTCSFSLMEAWSSLLAKQDALKMLGLIIFHHPFLAKLCKQKFLSKICWYAFLSN